MKQKYTLDHIEKVWNDQGYLKVPLDLDPNVVQDAVEAFLAFLEAPFEVKSAIKFKVNPNSRRGDVGYTSRDPKDHVYNDSKEYFHYHPGISQRYPEFLESHPVVKRFCNAAEPIWHAASRTVKEVLSAFDERYPGLSNSFFEAEEPETLLRFLKYNWQTSGKYLAKPHYDAGSCTLGIAESAPGLRIGSCDEDLAAVTHQPGEAVFMLSSNFEKLTKGEFAPSWHDVIQTDETLIGQSYARWAVVCFFEAKGLVAKTREQNRTAQSTA